jgi:hypothetical protein
MTGVGPLRVKLLGDATAGTFVTSGTSVPVDIHCKAAPAFYVRADGGTISAGVVTFEEADWDEQEMIYSGTWSSIGTLDVTALSTVTGQAVVHLQVSDYAYIRARISTALTGGGKINVTLRARG